MLEEVRPLFFETPVNSMDIEGTLEVARAVPVPVAWASATSGWPSSPSCSRPASSTSCSPKPCTSGSRTSARPARIAEAQDAVVACHQAQSPLCTAINAHLHASIPNFLIQECFDDVAEPWAWDLLPACRAWRRAT